MNYIGIDLAWKEGNKSGVAVINDSGEIIHSSSKSYTNSELSRLIDSFTEPKIISIDSPLQVKNNTGGRLCDSQLMKYSFNGKYLKIFATSRIFMDKHFGGIRGEQLLALFEAQNNLFLGSTVFETFPTGIVCSLIPELDKYKISSKLELASLKLNFKKLIYSLQLLGFSGEFPNIRKVKTKKEYKTYEDEIDGILCAVNSFYYGKLESFVQFGDGENGLTTIAIPLKLYQH